MNVCLFGGFDPAYPRHRILARGLERHGHVVTMAQRPAVGRFFRRWPALAVEFGRSGIESDLVLVPEFAHKDVPLARALAGRRTLVFDPLVSRWDTGLDRREYAAGSAKADWNRTVDRWSLALPDLVLCDTWAHGALFETLGARRERLCRVPVGAEEEFFSVAPPPDAGPVRILYVGGFLPLHGIGTVLEALARLERERLPEWEVELAGRGVDFDSARSRAREMGLPRVRFPGPVPYAELPARMAGAHVTLGAFGAGEKAGRVIPHKVHQGLAAGRAVVTGEGPGLIELFEPGVQLLAVKRGDAEALAAALARLVADAALRARLGAAGAARAREVGTPERVAAALLAGLARTSPRARRRSAA